MSMAAFLNTEKAENMNQVAIHYAPKDITPRCAGAMTAAERELNSFFTAVSDLYGAEQAELSADDWLDELMTTEVPPSSTRAWRGITLRASARLAARVQSPALASASVISGAQCGIG